MNIALIARYPGHQVGAVVDNFVSSELPPRHASLKELGSITYMDGDGYVTLFLLSVPDGDAAAAVTSLAKRQAFQVSRIPGLTIQVHLGLDAPTGVPMIMEVRPR